MTNNLSAIRATIPAHVTLIAVTKGRDAAAIEALIDAGATDFGENRVAEAREKWPAIRARHPHIRLHYIGPLQTGNIRAVNTLFDMAHTLCKPHHVADIDIPYFVQVNTGGEAQKNGVAPADLADLLRVATPVGLMCLPPVDDVPSLHFAFLKTLAARHGLTQLSMGMSDDYTAAIACGATHVRIGSALFANES